MILKTNNIIRSLKIVWESSKKWSAINAAIISLKGVLPLLLIFVIKELVDEVSIAVTNDSISDYNGVYNILFLTGGVFLLNGILSSISGIFNEKLSHYINDSVHRLIHDRSVKIDYSNFEDYNFQNIYHRAINEASYRPGKIYYGFVGLIQYAITLLLIGGLIATLHWYLLLILLCISLPIVLIRLNYSKKIYSLKRENTELEREVNYYNKLLTAKEFAKELRVFSLASIFEDRFEKLKKSFRQKQFNLIKVKSKNEFVVQVFTALALFVIFGFITFSAIKGKVSNGQLVMYFLALYRGYSFLQELLVRISSLYEDGLFLKNFYEFVDYRVSFEKKDKTHFFPKKIISGIKLTDVSFKYPNTNRNVFSKINLHLKPNETIALVGANGAGKTTLVKLLCGLYSPNSGIIEVDGVDLGLINNKSLADNVSVVFQDFMLYNTSARDNIWFGNVNSSKNSDEIYKSAQKSGIDELLNGLPKGYETTLGNLFKESEMLSVGEWQRMALSRSFFNNAQLVILDEPTSSMDAFTEAKLIDHFKEITKGRTAVIVSHRLSTIHLADRIIVLANNTIVEDGTPKELLEKRKYFYNMVMSVNRNDFYSN